MNDFLEQFALESRELVSRASDGLLRLERSPPDADCLDEVFRAFHTLKGGAGIVEFSAMERLVHAAEDRLGEARAGRREITPQLIGECLATLDQVSHWLDALTRTGELPQSSDAQAQTLIDRFAKTTVQQRTMSAVADQTWAKELITRHADAAGVLCAVRYVPDADCFFQGEDPVARMNSLPSLSVLEVAPVLPWPSLSELDPYSCNLSFTALCAAPADAVRAHMQAHSGTCEIVDAVVTASRSEGEIVVGEGAREILKAQLAMTALGGEDGFRGRIAAAGVAASNTLRSVGYRADASLLDAATAESLDAGSAVPLQRALRQLLERRSPAVVIPDAAPASQAPTRTLRIDAQKVDSLVRLTGELTTAKNALGVLAMQSQGGGTLPERALKEQAAIFERLVGELQRAVLAMRVLPLRTVLQRFPRVLRELSSTLGKPTMLDIQGDHTEADKAIVEMLFEPLLHTLRNAIDHGVEEPAERLSRGKPLVAEIRITATRQSDRVIIDIEDDGAGIDPVRIRHAALERAVATREELDLMSDAQVVDLVFAPGFSTAATVTDLSGRGVGLDAVRTAVERVGGQVAIDSRLGQGTKVRFSMPFSVMMTQVLTVEADGQCYAIPLDALIETLRVPAARLAASGAARVLVHRDRSLPVISLGGELGAGPGDTAGAEITVVVARVAGDYVALRVDRLGERMEVIMKPLEGLLGGMRGIAGTTLLGDGRVLLVLDLRELLE